MNAWKTCDRFFFPIAVENECQFEYRAPINKILDCHS